MRTPPLQVLALTAVLLVSAPAARAQSSTTLGVGSGAVAGALVAGPLGAVAGAVVGGLVGASTEGRRRHARRVRRYAAPAQRVRTDRRERRAEARPAAASDGARWTDPR